MLKQIGQRVCGCNFWWTNHEMNKWCGGWQDGEGRWGTKLYLKAMDYSYLNMLTCHVWVLTKFHMCSPAHSTSLAERYVDMKQQSSIHWGCMPGASGATRRLLIRLSDRGSEMRCVWLSPDACWIQYITMILCFLTCISRCISWYYEYPQLSPLMSLHAVFMFEAFLCALL